MGGFVHLAARTCYSLRDGAIRPHELAVAALDRGMDAVGIADRGGLYGAVRVAKACQAAGVRPIFGADLALGPDPSRAGWGTTRSGRRRSSETADERGRVRPRRGAGGAKGPGSGSRWLDDDAARIALIARTQRGYGNLCRAISDHHLESPRGDPHLTWAQLSRRPDGLFVLLGDSSPVARLLDAGRPDAAEAEARRWMDLAGQSSVLIGVTHHRARGDDTRARARFRLADRLGLRAVAHQAPRYLDPADARVADALDAIRQQVPLGPRHSARRNAEGFFKSPAQMAEVFAERPDAIANTAWAAEQCDVHLRLGERRVPDLVAVGETATAALRARCEAGVRQRYDRPGRRHRERLEDEFTMIGQLGLAPFFLTVAEIVDRIRSKRIMVACRGSAAGSLVTYALRISDVDPIAHDLCFERFMNPYRDELPDIDIDVESARRLDIYRDLFARYGEDRVACVAMVETLRARMAIREVGKALGLPRVEIDHIASRFPRIRAGDVRAALGALPELAGANLDRPDLRRLFDLVERLDGIPRHVALHPSGVLLDGVGLRDLVPVERSADGFPMAQADKNDVAALGLCKLDVLGVRMLSAMAHAVEEIRRVRAIELDLAQVPWDDEATFELIRSTRTLGMFQIESPGQRELIGKFQPEHFGDLIIGISLFRPGPVKGDMIAPFLQRRLGLGPTIIPHPLLEPALRETYGVIVYHEQVMRVVAVMTGCDLSTADRVRRQLGDPELLDGLRAWFLDGARERGVPDQAAERVWKGLAEFASFGFCKAHAAAFAVPTYRSAWLKAHFLPELVAGLLTHDPGMYPRRLLLADARQFGVAVLPPDVNRSWREYRVERVCEGSATHAPRILHTTQKYGIRIGLQDVAGIDDRMIDSLLTARPFASVEDLRCRSALSAPVAEALAHVGALDSLGPGSSRRDLLLEVSERWAGTGVRTAAEQPLRAVGPDGPPGLADYTLSERVRAELEVLGLEVTCHVVQFYEGLLDTLGVTRAKDLLGCRSGQRVRVAGAKVATQTPPVRSGRRVVFLSLDDATGVSDSVFFESVHDRCARIVFHGWLLVVEGAVRRTGRRGVSINADKAWDLSQLMRAWRQGQLDQALAEPGAPTDRDDSSRRLWHASTGSAGR
ncbi:MAG: DNA polymerase III subunit alpha [Egibacteraceae bacterium]